MTKPTGRPVGRPPAPPTAVVSSRVPVDLRREIWEIAETEGVPPHAVIREMLAAGVKRRRKRPAAASRPST